MYDEKMRNDLIKLMDGTGGNISSVCKALNISRKTFYRWMAEDAEFKEKVEEVTEACIDNVESRLYKSALEGDTTAMIFYLKTKGKNRGYTERIEVQPIEIISEVGRANKDEINSLFNAIHGKDGSIEGSATTGKPKGKANAGSNKRVSKKRVPTDSSE